MAEEEYSAGGSGNGLRHADPSQYGADLGATLDAFEQAVAKRYYDDLVTHDLEVWTPDGGTAGANDSLSSGPDANRINDRNEADNAPEWAAQIRSDVHAATPAYDRQDLDALDLAFGQLHTVAKALGHEDALGMMSSIVEDVNTINGLSGNLDAFTQQAEISGISKIIENNFGQYVTPTMENQCSLATSLVNLYAARASIIDAARRNTVDAIKRATNSLADTVDGAANSIWTVIGITSLAVGLPPGGTLPGTILGIISMVGAEKESASQVPEHSIKEVVDALHAELQEANDQALREEDDWARMIAKLQEEISGADSAYLELYDFVSNSGGSNGGEEINVDVNAVEELATLCFSVSESYESLIREAIKTDDADPELKGAFGTITRGDSELKDIRDAFVSFLQTTCARYYEAGSRLVETAKTYHDMEMENEGILNALADSPDLNGDESGNGGSVADHTGATERDDIEDWEYSDNDVIQLGEDTEPDPQKPAAPDET